MIATLSIQYSGFVVNVVGQNDRNYKRIWTPGRGEYEKNLFATYMYRGQLDEYNANTLMLNEVFCGEFFLNKNIILDFPSYELFPEDTTWLCFSSYKPYTADFLRLTEPTTIPSNVGVYNVLGNIEFEQQKIKALQYIKPRDYPIEISGNAKILLIKYGNFVNQPL